MPNDPLPETRTGLPYGSAFANVFTLNPAVPLLDESLAPGREIGSGAIATVREVIGAQSGSRLAAKVLHARHQRDAGARARFQREAELASGLVHPNIVRVFGVRDVQQRTALLMELVEGPTLAAHLATHQTLSFETLVPIARDIARGLSHAHARGVIHRDLKPANVLLTRDNPPVAKIADFGMARAASFAAADRRALTVLGTPPYMAPECLDPLAVDPRTDLYALGCIIYELATGAPPYGGSTPYAVLEAHRTAEIPSLPGAYGRRLDELTRRLLAKAPGERPQAAAAVLDALEHLSEPQTDASLVPVQHALAHHAGDATEGRCAGCGARVLAELRVCFRCGMVQLLVESGPCSVFVVGPGKLSHKFSSELRDKLVRWVRANAAAGLDPEGLEQRIPRLAFPLAVGLSAASAQTLVDSMRHLGILVETTRGGATSHPHVRRAAWALLRRGMTLAGAVASIPLMLNPLLGLPVTAVAIAAAFPFVLLFSRRSAFRTALRVGRGSEQRALPFAMQQRLDGLYRTVPKLKEARHREALRAVVHRTVDLTRTLTEAQQAEVADEMAHAINLAAVAAHRMDELDAQMARADFDPAHPEHRNSMHERDLWSGRLLDLTATLDALGARQASASHRLGDAPEAEALASLRATVESLEEVQSL
ncbi:MAG: protein kinase domain-containing protein [Nannocystales bacterium]